jgi:hypothetical protein
MRALLRSILLALVVVTTTSCSDALTGTDHTEVRFRNATTFTLTDISLAWPGGSIHVDALAPGASSTYESHDGAYSYGLLLVTAGGKVRRLQPIDYVGEQPLGNGKYTYLITESTSFADGIDMQLLIDN